MPGHRRRPGSTRAYPVPHSDPGPAPSPNRMLQAAMKRHEAGGAGAGGRAERSDGDGNCRQVSGGRHGGMWGVRLAVCGLVAMNLGLTRMA